MPELCRFYGIVIFMNPNDHNPPHFHARQGNITVSVTINDFNIEGRMSARDRRRVLEWAYLHQDELLLAWDRIRRGDSPGRIAPLE